MINDKDDKHIFLSRNVSIRGQEVEVKLPHTKIVGSLLACLLVGTILILPYFIEINWFLKLLFCVVIYSSLFMLYYSSDENKYLKNHILLDDNKHRVKVMK